MINWSLDKSLNRRISRAEMSYEYSAQMIDSRDQGVVRVELKEEGFIGWAVRMVCNVVGTISLFLVLFYLLCILNYGTIRKTAEDSSRTTLSLRSCITYFTFCLTLCVICFYVKRFVRRAECWLEKNWIEYFIIWELICLLSSSRVLRCLNKFFSKILYGL